MLAPQPAHIRQRSERGRSSVEVACPQPVAGRSGWCQIGELALVDDAPLVDDGNTVAYLLHLSEQMAREHDRHPLSGKSMKERTQKPNPCRIDAVCRLVQEQQPRTADQA